MLEVPPLLVVALNHGGARLLEGQRQRGRILEYVILMNVLLLQKMLHHVVDRLILKVLVNLMLM